MAQTESDPKAGKGMLSTSAAVSTARAGAVRDGDKTGRLRGGGTALAGGRVGGPQKAAGQRGKGEEAGA